MQGELAASKDELAEARSETFALQEERNVATAALAMSLRVGNIEASLQQAPADTTSTEGTVAGASSLMPAEEGVPPALLDALPSTSSAPTSPPSARRRALNRDRRGISPAARRLQADGPYAPPARRRPASTSPRRSRDAKRASTPRSGAGLTAAQTLARLRRRQRAASSSPQRWSGSATRAHSAVGTESVGVLQLEQRSDTSKESDEAEPRATPQRRGRMTPTSPRSVFRARSPPAAAARSAADLQERKHLDLETMGLDRETMEARFEVLLAQEKLRDRPHGGGPDPAALQGAKGHGAL